MPIYEYRCRKCGKKFEKLVLNSRKVACPDCKSEELDRLMSVFAHTSGGKLATSSTGKSCAGCSGKSCGNCG